MGKMFNTERCELIGDITFGSVFEKFLWEMNHTENEIATYIYEVMKNSPAFLELVDDISVDMIDGEFRPIYLIQIGLKVGDGTVKKRFYEFK